MMRGNIVKQILAGLVLGILLSWLSPDPRSPLACWAHCLSAR
jgi:Na+/serine symporter